MEKSRLKFSDIDRATYIRSRRSAQFQTQPARMAVIFACFVLQTANSDIYFINHHPIQCLKPVFLVYGF